MERMERSHGDYFNMGRDAAYLFLKPKNPSFKFVRMDR